MTSDGAAPIDEIRAALAAHATVPFRATVHSGYSTIVANAPTWLAWCVSEIERLRTDLEGLSADHLEANQDLVSREQRLSELYEWLHEAEAERDAALTENERLRAALLEMSDIRLERETERNAWRACADQLGAARWGDDARSEALAEYERLKGVDS